MESRKPEVKAPTPEVEPAPLSGGQGAGAAGSPAAGGAPTVRVNSVRLVRRLGYRKARELLESKDFNFKYIVGWAEFDAFGEYYVDVEKKLCLYLHYNDRTGTSNSALYEFDDIDELANWIWRSQAGTIPFAKIRRAFKYVLNVDVQMSPENQVIRLLFGEATR